MSNIITFPNKSKEYLVYYRLFSDMPYNKIIGELCDSYENDFKFNNELEKQRLLALLDNGIKIAKDYHFKEFLKEKRIELV